MNRTLPLIILVLFTSCLDEGGRRGQTPVANLIQQAKDCSSLFFDPEEVTCTTECPEGKTPGTEEDLKAYLDDLDAESDILLIESIKTAAGICVEKPEEIVRPSNQVFIQGSFCVCKDKLVASTNYDSSCPSRCQETSDAQSKDFRILGSVRVGESISLNEGLKNLNGWCRNPIDDGRVNPGCTLSVTDGNLDFSGMEVTINNNSFEAVLTTLPVNRTYRLNIVESGSGSNAKSDFIQFKMVRPFEASTGANNKALNTLALNMYTCISESERIKNNSNGEVSNKDYDLIHFLFPDGNEPLLVPQDFLPEDEGYVYCHDIQESGSRIQTPNAKLLQLRDAHLYMWDTNDPRFVQENGTSKINTMIATEAINRGAKVAASNIFALFQLPTGMVDLRDGVPQNLGFIMIPFVDEQTGISYCPGREQYNSDNILFNVMDTYVGNTEGIYIGVAAVTRDSGFKDFILMREGQLKKIWFYYDDNRNEVSPPANNPGFVRNKTMYFYWPPSDDPTIEKIGQQRLYTVRTPEQAFSKTQNQVPTSVATHDKKFGCIPSSDGSQ